MTVVLVDPRRPLLMPVEAVALLAGDVQYTEELPIRVPWSLPSARPVYDGSSGLAGPAGPSGTAGPAGPSGTDGPNGEGREAPVLLSSDPAHPAVTARLAAGERLIAAPPPRPGERLLDAVDVMDRLRLGGPWEREQTHDSLRRYLLEETYELFDAIRDGDPEGLSSELGDVLLQVLFHARIAQDAAEGAFGIDDVADALVRKLAHRAPAVLAGEDVSLADQLAQWEQRKLAESGARTRRSALDGVPTAQPALALAQKVHQRAVAAGIPADLIPAEVAAADAGGDAESELRSVVLDFVDAVHAAEAAGGRSGRLSEAQWREHWPAPGQ